MRHARPARCARERRIRRSLARRLETFDRAAGGSPASARGWSRRATVSTAAIRQRATRRAAAPLGTLAGRLDTLSPLAVLGRGYAVCWNADRTAIIRDAADVQPGDDVRVTLSEGEMRVTVTDRHEGTETLSLARLRLGPIAGAYLIHRSLT